MKITDMAAVALLVSILAAPVSATERLRTADLYETKCGRCHRLYEPQEYTPVEWDHWLVSMRDEAALTNNQLIDLEGYLTEASATTTPTRTGSGPYVGGYLYTEYFQTPEKTSNFDIHYLAITLSGTSDNKISYFAEFELEHGGKGDDTFVEQAFLDYWLQSWVAVKIGAMLTPFGRFDEMHDPIGNHLITRPQVAREIGVSAWKEVGIDLHGFINLGPQNALHFDLYTINGLGDGANLRKSRQYQDNNEDKALGGRLSIIHADRVELGGSVYSGAWDVDGKYDVTMLGAHARINTGFVDLLAEYRDATSQNPGTTGDGEITGFFVQASRLLSGQFRPAVRYGALDYLDPGNTLGRDPAKGDMDLTELAFGLAFYPTRDVAFKVEYNIFSEGDRMDERDNNLFGLQAAVEF